MYLEHAALYVEDLEGAKNVPDPRVHEHGQGIVNHRFVINRKQLLGCHLCQRVQAGTASSGQYNSLHSFPPGKRRTAAPFLRPRLYFFVTVQTAGRKDTPRLYCYYSLSHDTILDIFFQILRDIFRDN